MKVTRSAIPSRAKAEYTRAIPILNGSATFSVKTSGAAPVPPSPPSTVMKSTARSSLAIRRASSSQKPLSPIADLMPTGRPVSSASISTKSSISSTSPKAEWRDGETQSSFADTSRTFAISSVTFEAGRSPPRPGFAPWLSLISSARMGASSSRPRSSARLKRPLRSRQPK